MTEKLTHCGQVVCDMHDGYDFSEILTGTQKAKVTDRVTIDCANGQEFIEGVIEQATSEKYRYTNKHLVVIGETAKGTTMAYSWDGLKLTVINVVVE